MFKKLYLFDSVYGDDVILYDFIDTLLRFEGKEIEMLFNGEMVMLEDSFDDDTEILYCKLSNISINHRPYKTVNANIDLAPYGEDVTGKNAIIKGHKYIECIDNEGWVYFID